MTELCKILLGENWTEKILNINGVKIGLKIVEFD